MQRRAGRNRSAIPIISIVGYTNAGKSTLLNALTRSDVHVEDKLFATLDPASRRLRFPRERDVILTDTVGFIQDLPPDLANAFRSTLEELEDADILLHVADLSSPYVEEQIKSVEEILHGMDLDRTPRMLLFNKSDLVPEETAQRLARRHNGLVVSALTGKGLAELSRRMQEMLFGGTRPVPGSSPGEGPGVESAVETPGQWEVA